MMLMAVTNEYLLRAVWLGHEGKPLGTGTIITRNHEDFLVTADHIARGGRDKPAQTPPLQLEFRSHGAWHPIAQRGWKEVQRDKDADLSLFRRQPKENSQRAESRIGPHNAYLASMGMFLGFPILSTEEEPLIIEVNGKPLPMTAPVSSYVPVGRDGLRKGATWGYGSPGFSGGPLLLPTGEPPGHGSWTMAGIVIGGIDEADEENRPKYTPRGIIEFATGQAIEDLLNAELGVTTRHDP